MFSPPKLVNPKTGVLFLPGSLNDWDHLQQLVLDTCLAHLTRVWLSEASVPQT